MQKAVHSGLPFVVQKMKIWRFIMADENMNTIHITEKQKVQEITDKLEEGLKELFESEMNILAARNRKSGNLEIGVPALGNRLFCA